MGARQYSGPESPARGWPPSPTSTRPPTGPRALHQPQGRAPDGERFGTLRLLDDYPTERNKACGRNIGSRRLHILRQRHKGQLAALLRCRPLSSKRLRRRAINISTSSARQSPCRRTRRSSAGRREHRKRARRGTRLRLRPGATGGPAQRVQPQGRAQGLPHHARRGNGAKYTVDELAKGFGLDPAVASSAAVTLKSLVDRPELGELETGDARRSDKVSTHEPGNARRPTTPAPGQRTPDARRWAATNGGPGRRARAKSGRPNHRLGVDLDTSAQGDRQTRAVGAGGDRSLRNLHRSLAQARRSLLHHRRSRPARNRGAVRRPFGRRCKRGGGEHPPAIEIYRGHRSSPSPGKVAEQGRT